MAAVKEREIDCDVLLKKTNFLPIASKIKFVFLMRVTAMSNTHPPDTAHHNLATSKVRRDHVWKPGADVQSVWKKFGWTPPSKQGAVSPSRERTAANHALRVLRG